MGLSILSRKTCNAQVWLLILAVVVFLEMLMIFGLIGLLPIPLYLLPKEIVVILPCIIFLLALAYACRGKLGLFFKVPTFNDVKIIYAYDSPKQYGLDDGSVKIQMEYITEKINGIPVNCFFSSEPYGEKVAQYLNIENRIVDMDREKVPISAGLIRDNIEKHKHFLDNKIYKEINNKTGF